MFSNNFVENWLKYDLLDLFLLYIVYLLGKIYTFFFKISIEMFIKKHLPILEKLYKQNEKIAQNIPLEETDIDSYFFPVILDIARTDYRTIRISKGFEFCTFSIKKFVFDDFIYTQAF